METYNGHVRTPADAIILFEACRLGHLPRVQRRLSEKERQQIKSGSVFVWDEREAGMRRWTDGKSWSASRVSGSFLTYREMEGKRGGSSFSPHVSSVKRTPNGNYKDPGKSDTDMDMAMADDGPDGYRYKPDGLMKQSFSITTSQGQHLHLISYYARSHPSASSLVQPTSDPSLRHIRPAKGMYPETTMQDGHQMPAVTRSPMIGSPYAASPYAPSPSQMSSHSSYSRPGSYQHHALAAPPGHAAYIPPSPMQSPHSTHHPYANGSEYRSPQSSTNSPMYHQSHYQAHLRPPTGPTAFDRPPTSNLPPPPPMPHSHHPPPPQYNGYTSSPSAPGYPPSHAHYSHASATSHPYSHPPPPPPPPPATQHQTHSPTGHAVAPYRHDPPPYNRTASPSSSHSEPRIGPASHGYTTSQDQRREAPPLRPFPSPESQKDSDAHAPQPTKTIPSIGSLINTSPPPPAHRPDPILGHLHGRATPPSSEMSKQLGYGEDKRALSKLDKAFST